MGWSEGLEVRVVGWKWSEGGCMGDGVDEGVRGSGRGEEWMYG